MAGEVGPYRTLLASWPDFVEQRKQGGVGVSLWSGERKEMEGKAKEGCANDAGACRRHTQTAIYRDSAIF